MAVHDVAARGFGSAAEAYDRGRPAYPAVAVAWLIERMGIGPGATVCDLAAGTGKLTRSLVPTESFLLAVEPLEGMRVVLARELPTVATVAGTAEALPVRSATLDAVLVAQAFHWFDTASSLDELARCIRPAGRLALVWNAWDDSHGWVERIHRVVADRGSTAQWQRGHRSRSWAGQAIAAHPAFGPVDRMQFAHGQRLTPDGVVERVATTSHIVSADPPARDAALAAVRAILAEDPETRGRETLEFPYVTEVYVSDRR